MHEIDRRELLMMGSAAGAMAVGGHGANAQVNSAGPADERASGGEQSPPVLLYGDGLGLTPAQHAGVLARLTGEGGIEKDNYSLGGSVERLEGEMAQRLGKERAVFFPTGTLANMIAVRELARRRQTGSGRGDGRVLVQEESHIYNDAGDGCQELCGLHLIGLESGESTFSLERVENEVERAASGRVRTPVRVISVESPVRRLWGRVFDYEQMRRISEYARERGIGMHLDGARLFLAQPYTGVTPTQYAALFDTVYVSLWKYFNAASGAVLAGPADLLDGIFHERRRFGGSLPSAWPLASMAAHHVEGFETRFAAAVAAGESVLANLALRPAFGVDRVPEGTNVAKLRVDTGDLAAYRSRLADAGIDIAEPLPDGSGFKVQVNETWLRLPPEDLCDRMEHALG